MDSKEYLAKQNAEMNEKFASAADMTVEEWNEHVELCRHQARMEALVQVDALLAANWKMQIPSHENYSEPFQLQWRRPPRRPGSKGMLFLSTNQAFNALRKEQREKTDKKSAEKT